MQDDIDWMNASSDFGLAELCRQMEALAVPAEKLIRRRTPRMRPAPRAHALRARAA